MNSLHPLTQLICFGLICVLYVGCSQPKMPAPATANSTAAPASTNGESAPSAAALTEEAPQFGPAPAGKVLRHAVFFAFKPDSSDEDIQGVVDAFRELPSKIEEIIGFEWGVNNSEEGFSDEFTHCFLLTFKDEAGRAVYLPHEAHKAFGDVLRPHMAKVFVIDYWGTPVEAPLEKELKHAVFFRFKQEATPAQIEQVEQGFAALPSKIDAIKGFEWGINNSPEKHADGFTHCFMVTFDSEEGRAAYLPHAEHQAFVELIMPVLDAPRVLDFWAEK